MSSLPVDLAAGEEGRARGRHGRRRERLHAGLQEVGHRPSPRRPGNPPARAPRVGSSGSPRGVRRRACSRRDRRAPLRRARRGGRDRHREPGVGPRGGQCEMPGALLARGAHAGDSTVESAALGRSHPRRPPSVTNRRRRRAHPPRRRRRRCPDPPATPCSTTASSSGQLVSLEDPEAVDAAVEAGVLVVDGDHVRASHPLLAAAAVRHAPAAERRELHRASPTERRGRVAHPASRTGRRAARRRARGDGRGRGGRRVGARRAARRPSSSPSTRCG